MHLLKAQVGGIEDGSEPVDLSQSPGDIVLLTSADTEISGLARAKRQLGDEVPSLRLASLLQLTHNFSVDLYVERTLQRARLIVLRLLGGPSYWRYGLDEVVRLARGSGIKLAVVPGTPYPDPVLDAYATLPKEDCDRLWSYLVEGGPENYENFLRYGAHLLGEAEAPASARPLPKAGLYWPGETHPDLDALRGHWTDGAPVAAIVFYRALIQAGDLAAVDELAEGLRQDGINALPVYVTSLKDGVAAEALQALFADADPDVVLNLTAFAVAKPGADWTGTPLDHHGAPVFQVVLAGSNEAGWLSNPRGLSARDIAMNVSLPEIDGRILSRAISFKAERTYDKATETSLAAHAPRPDRVAFVARLARNWTRLRRTPANQRRVAVVLSNYPSSDGRIANGVGLDTPAGTLALLDAMRDADYPVEDLPSSGDALIRLLQSGPTNAGVTGREIRETLSRAQYDEAFDALPARLRAQMRDRWGEPEGDNFYLPDREAFAISAMRLGGTVLGVQPGRGPGLDPKEAHHDPTIVPPHGYLAFYAWLRQAYDAHAIVHMGKHGNLEWLPGKSLALSSECFVEAVFGPMPHVYPFIANDPGEGSQAKRRTSAVVVDHLTPPLTRADTYGPLKDLEALVDEYYEASGVDPRRLELLGRRILETVQSIGVDRDCGIEQADGEDAALGKLDNFLCELKEMQIRDGLHVFGRSPVGRQLADLLVALVRLPRQDGEGRNASLTRALALDLGLDGFDPLDCEMAASWKGPWPSALTELDSASWRSTGDTIERLELLAAALLNGETEIAADWARTRAVLDEIDERVRPAVEACGDHEIRGALTALDGRFVAPGPSGAPTRGRLDVLPTGRNFYSVDSRTVPTGAAWELGQASAERLVTAYRQEHGAWPVQMAISAWGTSNMRTGGDDIAQALALIGARPTWDKASRRVTGYEVMALSELKRPRVDVVFRISGFFRDAFPAQIDLLDTAIRAVAARDEPADANPLAARVESDAGQLVSEGVVRDAAEQRASRRIFGSKPGAYGAGLKDMIETGAWETADDLARAYIETGGYAYGAGTDGEADLA
ncbi:MAG: cobaltochelatase subunit CobN, partial [Methyloligellaceae bacterium]